jgi:hypothetical protein
MSARVQVGVMPSCDFTQLREMRHQLRTGLVDGLHRRARQFELPAGLE